MSEATVGFFRKNATTLILATGLVAYVLVAGKTGFCPACSAVTSLVGLSPSKPGGADLSMPSVAPSWELNDLQGQSVRSSDLEGKVVVLGFWATWCPPCRKEVPGFIELQKEFGDEDVVVVGVSLDQGGPEVVAPFVEATGINYAVLMGDAEMVEAYGGIPSIPTTFLIDRTGRIVERFVGYTSKSRFEASIRELL